MVIPLIVNTRLTDVDICVQAGDMRHNRPVTAPWADISWLLVQMLQLPLDAVNISGYTFVSVITLAAFGRCSVRGGFPFNLDH